uniref:RING-type domain-containing protein n=1 Tax=Onchocerca volvulus TaxID=6282 RepID=A0A8R1TZB7_ONCVO
MEDSIGGCVICAQNLCIDNFSSLPCGHTFHYKCILRWLCCSEQCPTCRAHTSPANIVKRLYFAKCGDKAMDDVENSADTTVANHNNEFVPTENVLLPQTSEDFYGNYHGNDESYDSADDYDNDSEDGDEHEWTMGIIGADSDSANDNNSSVIASEDSESAAESEADNQENEEEPEYHGIISDTDMASVFDVSLSDTSSASLRSISESCSEIDAASISSLNHDIRVVSFLHFLQMTVSKIVQ